MATHQTLILWEKTAYYRVGEKGWARAALARLDDVISVVQEHFAKKSKIALIYDPDMMHTELAECPPGGRALAREVLAATHETISNMHTAWGIQIPWTLSGGGGNHGTFCSYETAPALYSIMSTLRELGYTVDTAFPLASLAAQVDTNQGGGSTQIFLVIDKDSQAFVYIRTMTGIRAARKLYAGKREGEYNVWNEINMVFGEYGVTFDDGGQRPQMRIYQAPGTDIKTQCPFWPELHQQAQTEVLNFNSLEVVLGTLHARHPSFLMADMPRFIDTDFGFQVAAGVLFALLLGFGIYAYLDLHKDSEAIRTLQTRDNGLAAQERKLNSNKTEIERLNNLYAQGIFEMSEGRLKLIELLPAAIPREATLTHVSVGAGGSTDFRLSGIFWNWKSMHAQPGRNTFVGAAATAATPFTAIKSTLESNIQGLLIQPANAQIQPTGDFYIQGTTPQPESPPMPAVLAAPLPSPHGRR